MSTSLTVRKLQAEEGFHKNAARLGVDQSFIGLQFTAEKSVYQVLGLNRRVRKTPVIAVDTNQSDEASPRIRWFTIDYVKANQLNGAAQ